MIFLELSFETKVQVLSPDFRHGQIEKYLVLGIIFLAFTICILFKYWSVGWQYLLLHFHRGVGGGANNFYGHAKYLISGGVRKYFGVQCEAKQTSNTESIVMRHTSFIVQITYP